jgi:hypothetical protein
MWGIMSDNSTHAIWKKSTKETFVEVLTMFCIIYLLVEVQS